MRCLYRSGRFFGKECCCADCFHVGRECSSCGDSYYPSTCDGTNTDCDDHLPVRACDRAPLPEWDDPEYPPEPSPPPALNGSHSKADVARIYEQQHGKCWWCGIDLTGKKYHKDHRIAKTNGGSNNPENIVISCPRCNTRKGTKSPEEFAHRLF
jgi:5-methylcytosine-specific restriction endonuclease McrA